MPGTRRHQFDGDQAGMIKKTALSEFDSIRKSGIIAIGLDEGDVLVDVKLADEKREVFLGTKDGMCIRFRRTRSA